MSLNSAGTPGAGHVFHFSRSRGDGYRNELPSVAESGSMSSDQDRTNCNTGRFKPEEGDMDQQPDLRPRTRYISTREEQPRARLISATEEQPRTRRISTTEEQPRTRCSASQNEKPRIRRISSTVEQPREAYRRVSECGFEGKAARPAQKDHSSPGHSSQPSVPRLGQNTGHETESRCRGDYQAEVDGRHGSPTVVGSPDKLLADSGDVCFILNEESPESVNDEASTARQRSVSTHPEAMDGELLVKSNASSNSMTKKVYEKQHRVEVQDALQRKIISERGQILLDGHKTEIMQKSGQLTIHFQSRSEEFNYSDQPQSEENATYSEAFPSGLARVDKHRTPHVHTRDAESSPRRHITGSSNLAQGDQLQDQTRSQLSRSESSVEDASLTLKKTAPTKPMQSSESETALKELSVKPIDIAESGDGGQSSRNHRPSSPRQQNNVQRSMKSTSTKSSPQKSPKLKTPPSKSPLTVKWDKEHESKNGSSLVKGRSSRSTEARDLGRKETELKKNTVPETKHKLDSQPSSQHVHTTESCPSNWSSQAYTPDQSRMDPPPLVESKLGEQRKCHKKVNKHRSKSRDTVKPAKPSILDHQLLPDKPQLDQRAQEKDAKASTRIPRLTEASGTESLDSKSRDLLHQLEMVKIYKKKAGTLLKHVQNIVDGSHESLAKAETHTARAGETFVKASENNFERQKSPREKPRSKTRDKSTQQSPMEMHKTTSSNFVLAAFNEKSRTKLPDMECKSTQLDCLSAVLLCPSPKAKSTIGDEAKKDNGDKKENYITVQSVSNLEDLNLKNRYPLQSSADARPEHVRHFRYSQFPERYKRSTETEPARRTPHNHVQEFLKEAKTRPYEPGLCQTKQAPNEFSKQCLPVTGHSVSYQERLHPSDPHQVPPNAVCYDNVSDTTESLDSACVYNEICPAGFHQSSGYYPEANELALLQPQQQQLHMRKRSPPSGALGANARFHPYAHHSRPGNRDHKEADSKRDSRSTMKQSLKDAIKSARQSLSAAARVAEALSSVVRASTDSSSSASWQEEQRAAKGSRKQSRSPGARGSRYNRVLSVRPQTGTTFDLVAAGPSSKRELVQQDVGHLYKNRANRSPGSKNTRKPSSPSRYNRRASPIIGRSPAVPRQRRKSLSLAPRSPQYNKVVPVTDFCPQNKRMKSESFYLISEYSPKSLVPCPSGRSRHGDGLVVTSEPGHNLLSPAMGPQSPQFTVQITFNKSPESSPRLDDTLFFGESLRRKEKTRCDTKNSKRCRRNQRVKGYVYDQSSEMTVSKEEWLISRSSCNSLHRTGSTHDEVEPRVDSLLHHRDTPFSQNQSLETRRRSDQTRYSARLGTNTNRALADDLSVRTERTFSYTEQRTKQSIRDCHWSQAEKIFEQKQTPIDREQHQNRGSYSGGSPGRGFATCRIASGPRSRSLHEKSPRRQRKRRTSGKSRSVSHSNSGRRGRTSEILTCTVSTHQAQHSHQLQPSYQTDPCRGQNLPYHPLDKQEFHEPFVALDLRNGASRTSMGRPHEWLEHHEGQSGRPLEQQQVETRDTGPSYRERVPSSSRDNGRGVAACESGAANSEIPAVLGSSRDWKTYTCDEKKAAAYWENKLRTNGDNSNTPKSSNSSYNGNSNNNSNTPKSSNNSYNGNSNNSSNSTNYSDILESNNNNRTIDGDRNPHSSESERVRTHISILDHYTAVCTDAVLRSRGQCPFINEDYGLCTEKQDEIESSGRLMGIFGRSGLDRIQEYRHTSYKNARSVQESLVKILTNRDFSGRRILGNLVQFHENVWHKLKSQKCALQCDRRDWIC